MPTTVILFLMLLILPAAGRSFSRAQKVDGPPIAQLVWLASQIGAMLHHSVLDSWLPPAHRTVAGVFQANSDHHGHSRETQQVLKTPGTQDGARWYRRFAQHALRFLAPPR